MLKHMNEIRDPIHAFIKLSNDERKILDSRPFQRLRYIHQLAMTYLVYPGATHKRFEHSLGVMELASRVYDVVTNPYNIHDKIRPLFPEISDDDKRCYWRHVLRVAALCHDLGHLPFSHAAEGDLLPDGWDHERVTEKICDGMTPHLRKEDIVKISLGPRKAQGYAFSDWESVLSEIIVGDAFGVDRIDYLLRDSHHIGVAYGKFDHYRLIDTIRILPPPSMTDSRDSIEPSLGIEEGGLQSAEALLIARYFMFSQVYFHHVRRIYDIHLKDFLKNWLENGYFSIEIDDHLNVTDNIVLSAIFKAALKPDSTGHIHAKRITEHKHYKVLYRQNHRDQLKDSDAVYTVFKAACNEFGEKSIKCDIYTPKGQNTNFPVLLNDGNIVYSHTLSSLLKELPDMKIGYVFADPVIVSKAKTWLKNNKDNIIKRSTESENSE